MNTTTTRTDTLKIIQLTILLGACWFAASSVVGAEAPSLNPHLQVLQPLLGKTWKGVFEGSKPDNPTVDISRWERALNGQAVRVLHSINQGAYGGETMFVWNEKDQIID